MSDVSGGRPSKYANQVIGDDQPTPKAAPVPAQPAAPPTPSATTPKAKTKKLRSTPSPFKLILACAVAVLLMGGIVFWLTRSHQQGPPAAVSTASADFKAYYFTDNQPPDGLVLKPASDSYSSGTLVFSLTDSKGQTVGVTQQKVPADFATSTLVGKESFDTAYGKATVSEVSGGRTTGSLITKDGTFVLVNTADPVSLNNIKDVLRSLAPIQ